MSGAPLTMVATTPFADRIGFDKKLYDNPLINATITFIEPFPIGLVITLISAAILRKKPQSQVATIALARHPI